MDGPDAAGKTTLAEELANRLNGVAELIRAGIDGFHQPRAVRYRRGRMSPEGAYHDTFDYTALRSALLDPLGPGGDRCYRTAVFDYRTDQSVNQPVRRASPGAILIFEGGVPTSVAATPLLGRQQFLDVSPNEVLRRVVARDAESMGGPARVLERYSQRYLPAQASDGFLLFLCPPERHAAVRLALSGLRETPFRLGTPGTTTTTIGDGPSRHVTVTSTNAWPHSGAVMRW